MVIGSSTGNQAKSLTIQCSSSESLDLDMLLQLKIYRQKFTEPYLIGIASMKFDGLAKLDPTVPSDIQIRSTNMTGSVETGLKSGAMTLYINAEGLTCTDQAEFQCSLTYLDINQISQTVNDNKIFTVITVPSEVIMDSPEYYDVNGNTMQLTNNSVHDTGTRIKFKCTANVGSVPEGEIVWERSSEMGTMNSFIPYTPTPSTDIVQEASQQNGCFYRRTSYMYYNLTNLDDDGISFRCRARTYLSGQLYDALSNQQYRAVVAVNAVSLSFDPPSMVIGSSSVNPTTSLYIKCSSSLVLNVDASFRLKLSRRKFTEPTFVGIASMTFDGLAKLDPTVPSDIQTRSPNITGHVDTGLKSGTMTVSINAQGLSCTDQAEFQCSLNYVNPSPSNLLDNKNFTVITVPSEVSIDSPEYYDVTGNTHQLSNNSLLKTGTRIKYRCTANVGKLPEGTIIWERSRIMGSVIAFIPYNPAQVTDIVQETSRQDGCFYRRTSTMYYNLTKLDKDGISFRCKARTYLGGQLYEALANQQYRAVADPSVLLIGSTTQQGKWIYEYMQHD
ncbi:hypothetical protein ACJMK2_026883 [Sinanodonta woodiana]|uniref:Ig-like domain-containing protein n=1 Tax=Sinanodonta woodiana TaxID=1069815 RepID=A0ABD3XL60_SINWO